MSGNWIAPNWIEPNTLARFAAEKTTLHRLYSAAGNWIERYGDDLLFCLYRPEELDLVRRDYQAWAKETGFSARRIFIKHLQQQPGNERYTLLEGDPALPTTTVCTENGLHYQIDFASGYSSGFFIDQRENRRFLQSLRPRTVLNCFAYTCSFSVAAASAGAQTTSVDIAKRSLDWGRANFKLNGLDLEKGEHRFWPDDVRDVLRRQGQRESRFDTIILDPPTFARNQKGKVFRVEDDLPELIDQAFPLLEPGGHLLLSTNCERLTEDSLLEWATTASRTHRRPFTRAEIPETVDIPFGEGARSVWVRVE